MGEHLRDYLEDLLLEYKVCVCGGGGRAPTLGEGGRGEGTNQCVEVVVEVGRPCGTHRRKVCFPYNFTSTLHVHTSPQVDAVLSGHVHSYYRSCSVREETCTDDNTGEAGG